MVFTITAILVTLAAIAIYAARQPDEFLFERSTRIHATPAVIFPYLNDVRRQAAWSPWEKKDPEMRKTLEGPNEGVGAVVVWDGNRQVGAGRSEIVASTPNESVITQLDFLRPMPGRATAEYRLTPDDTATTVTWSMSGRQDYKAKLLGTLVDCEKICGREFDKGLAELKRLVESDPAA